MSAETATDKPHGIACQMAQHVYFMYREWGENLCRPIGAFTDDGEAVAAAEREAGDESSRVHVVQYPVGVFDNTTRADIKVIWDERVSISDRKSESGQAAE